MRTVPVLACLVALSACAAADQDCQGAVGGSINLYGNDTGRGSMRIKNNGQWCAFAITSRVGAMGGRLEGEPEHGIARVLQQSDKLVIGYLPTPGYTGDDQFKVAIAGSAHLIINVDVVK